MSMPWSMASDYALSYAPPQPVERSLLPTLGYIALLLLIFVPILGWFALFVIFLLNGTTGRNRYGPDPKDPGSADVFS